MTIPASDADAAPLRFVPLHAATRAQRAAFLSIYRNAIPLSERKTDAAILAMADRPDCVLELAERGGAAVGFLILYRSSTYPVALLEYLGVAASARGSGLGGRLFARVAAHAHGHTLLMEVETDRDTAAPDHAQRVRRKRFYARQGCRQLAQFTYRLPTLGEKAPPPMDLLFLTGRDAVDRATLLAWLTDIYSEVYGRPADDPGIARMMAGLPDQLAFEPI